MIDRQGFQPISRPRVIERLAASARYPITLVIAPAGFGKSVALAEFLRPVPSSVVYNVPSDATSLLPFVRGFAEALQEIVPAMRRSLATALEGIRLSQMPGQDLALWAAAHIGSLKTVLVVDDLHVAEGDVEVSRFIVALVDKVAAGVRWIFSSRSPLQLPIASWLAYARCDAVIDADDLRFDLDEAHQAAIASRTGASLEDLPAIHNLTDGWPAALAFAIRTSTRANDLRAVAAGTRAMVYPYLAEQLWNSLNDRVRGFLRMAAFLPELDLRFGIAAGYDDFEVIIATLRKRVAFVSEAAPNVYKLHDLFRDFVQHQVTIEGLGALREAHTKAARVLEDVGMAGQALERYILAKALPEIAALLSAEHYRLLDSGHGDMVERALRLLPKGRLASDPALLGLRAALEEFSGRADRAERLYVAAITRANDLSLRIKLVARYGVFVQQQSRADAIQVLEELVVRDDVDDLQRANLLGILASTYAVQGHLEEAERSMAEAIHLAEIGDDDELRARTYSRAAIVSFCTVDEAGAERYLRDGLALATQMGLYALAARTAGAQHATRVISGRLRASLEAATEAASYSIMAGDPNSHAMTLRSRYQIETELGDVDGVAKTASTLARISYLGPAGLSGLLFGKMMTLAWQRDFAGAQAVIAPGVLPTLIPHQRRLCAALLSVVSAAAGDNLRAADALAAYERDAPVDGDPGGTFDRSRAIAERLAILGTLLVGKETIAQRMLRHIRYRRPNMAAFDAALRALVARSAQSLHDATETMRRGDQGGFAMLIEAVLPTLWTDRMDREGQLTETELQILRRMGQGQTNEAMAGDLRRSTNTVRTHVSSILRKLGANNRGEAVVVGRRRNLID